MDRHVFKYNIIQYFMKSHSLNFITSISPGPASINGTTKNIDDSTSPHVPVGSSG